MHSFTSEVLVANGSEGNSYIRIVRSITKKTFCQFSKETASNYERKAQRQVFTVVAAWNHGEWCLFLPN